MSSGNGGERRRERERFGLKREARERKAAESMGLWEVVETWGPVSYRVSKIDGSDSTAVNPLAFNFTRVFLIG